MRYIPAMASLHTVVVVVFHDVAPFEMSVPCEVFGVDRSDMGLPNYRLVLAAVDPPPIRTSVGFLVDGVHSLRVLSRADTIVVPGWRHSFDPVPDVLLRALQRAHDRGARLASVCTGSFVLAAAGLLDGKRATTHWMHAARLQAMYPKVDVDPAVLYVDEGSILTSAGTAAGIDLCLHMVRRDHGAEVANLFARRMVVPPHRDGGQAQFVETPLPALPHHDGLGPTLEWAVRHLGQDLTVERLARRARLSPRTFARRFKAETGTTPLQWLLSQRVLAAQRLLESSDLPVDRVADAVGFGPATLRLHFGRVVGTSPTAYRATFRQRDPQPKAG